MEWHLWQKSIVTRINDIFNEDRKLNTLTIFSTRLTLRTLSTILWRRPHHNDDVIWKPFDLKCVWPTLYDSVRLASSTRWSTVGWLTEFRDNRGTVPWPSGLFLSEVCRIMNGGSDMYLTWETYAKLFVWVRCETGLSLVTIAWTICECRFNCGSKNMRHVPLALTMCHEAVWLWCVVCGMACAWFDVVRRRI